MSSTIKDTMFDKAIDCLLDILANASKDEINDLIDNKQQQKILFKVISSFAKSIYFKNECKDVIYQENKDLVFSIPADSINATKTIEQLIESISSTIDQCFLTEDKDVLTTIKRHIVSLYLQRAKMTIQLFDLVRIQYDGFSEMTKNMQELKNIILSNRRYEIELRHEKESLLKKELNHEVTSVISEMLRSYLYFILKKSPTFSGKEMDDLGNSMIQRISEMTSHMTDFVKNDFFQTPICVTKINGFESKTEEIDYFVFSEYYFRELILQDTDKLLKYKDIIDIENYVIILRLRNKLQSVLFPPLLQMGQTNLIKCNNFIFDVGFLCKELSEIGDLLVLLYNKMLL